MDIITMHSLFLKCKWEWSRWFSQMYSFTVSLHVHICPALGPEPRPRDHEFPNFGRSLHGHHGPYHAFTFFIKYIWKWRRRFFKVLNTFRYLHYYAKYYTIRIGKQAKCLFEPSPSTHFHYMFILVPSYGQYIGPFLWPAYWSLPMAWISDPVTIIFTI